MDYDLQILLQLRREGLNYSELGRIFDKDHSTIRHHCIKAGIDKPTKRVFDPDTHTEALEKLRNYRAIQQEIRLHESRAFQPIPPPKYQALLEEGFYNGQKMYADFHAEAITRSTEANYERRYHTHFTFTSIKPSVKEIRGEDYEPDSEIGEGGL